MGLFITYICIGVFEGIIFCILFFRMDSSWKKFLSFGGGSGGLVGTFVGLNKLLSVNKIYQQNLFTALVVTSLVSAIICFILLCILLKKQKDTNAIRTLDIVLGYQNYLKNYYINRQKEIDALLQYDKLDLIRKELEQKENQLVIREKVLNETKNNLEDSLANTPSLCLPLKSKIPIDNSFVEVLPSFIESIAIFMNDISNITNAFLDKYNTYKNNEYNYIIGYFLAICTYISKSLFDSNSNNVRVHIRVRVNDKYEKLVASLGGNEFKGVLTPMPIDKGMIPQSFKAKSSLIKSLNIEHHIKGETDSLWQEYITFALNNILCNDSIPFLAVGISVRNREKYKRFIQFLNYYKIENLIQEYVNKINNKCSIMAIIEHRISQDKKEVI